jgi:hypothetical protein
MNDARQHHAGDDKGNLDQKRGIAGEGQRLRGEKHQTGNGIEEEARPGQAPEGQKRERVQCLETADQSQVTHHEEADHHCKSDDMHTEQERDMRTVTDSPIVQRGFLQSRQACRAFCEKWFCFYC